MDEENEDGEVQLESAAADGVGAGDLKLLVAAGARVNKALDAVSGAVVAAASYGQSEAVAALLKAKATIDVGDKVGHRTRSDRTHDLVLSGDKYE